MELVQLINKKGQKISHKFEKLFEINLINWLTCLEVLILHLLATSIMPTILEGSFHQYNYL